MSFIDREADWPQPQPSRLWLGFAVAPLVPSALFAILPQLDGIQNGSYLGWVALVAIFGGYLPTLLVGLPTYFIFRHHIHPRLGTLAAFGGLVASLPWLLLELILPNVGSASINGIPTVVDGRTTWFGVFESAQQSAVFLALGSIGGATFWLCAIWRDQRFSQPQAPDAH